MGQPFKLIEADLERKKADRCTCCKVHVSRAAIDGASRAVGERCGNCLEP
jgi:hypothetical protein